jgi:hypothetical protein
MNHAQAITEFRDILAAQTHVDHALVDAMQNSVWAGVQAARATHQVTLDEALEVIRNCLPSDFLHVMDEVTEKMATIAGCATGCEDDRHNFLLQVQSEEYASGEKVDYEEND